MIKYANLIQLSDRKRNVYGISTTEASERFLENAVDAIVQRTNGPAALLYRNIARHNSLAARLEMLVFCFEFKVIWSIYPIWKCYGRSMVSSLSCIRLLQKTGLILSSVHGRQPWIRIRRLSWGSMISKILSLSCKRLLQGQSILATLREIFLAQKGRLILSWIRHLNWGSKIFKTPSLSCKHLLQGKSITAIPRRFSQLWKPHERQG